MIRRSSKRPSYLTQAEVRALFAAISNLRDRTLFGLAYAYGLRVGEIVLLDRDDIDLERGRIRIRRLKGGLSGERPIFRNLLPLLREYLKAEKTKKRRSSSVSGEGSRSAGYRMSSASTPPRLTFRPPFATFMFCDIRLPFTFSTRAKTSISPGIISGTGRSSRR
jgi:integrase